MLLFFRRVGGGGHRRSRYPQPRPAVPRRGTMRRRLVVSSGKQTIAMLLSLVVTLPNLGCSFLQRPTQPVSIMATDPSALIYVNGAAVGTGAATVELARNHAHEVMARTPDGRVGTAKITSSLSSAGLIDIIFGLFLLVPFLGLLSPGSSALTTQSVVIPVQPAATGAATAPPGR